MLRSATLLKHAFSNRPNQARFKPKSLRNSEPPQHPLIAPVTRQLPSFVALPSRSYVTSPVETFIKQSLPANAAKHLMPVQPIRMASYDDYDYPTEEEDFLHSEFKPNSEALKNNLALNAEPTSTQPLHDRMEDDEHDDFAEMDKRDDQPKTFDELFGKPFNNNMKSLNTPEVDLKRQEDEFKVRLASHLSNIYRMRRRRDLLTVQASFMAIFTMQTRVPPQLEELHHSFRVAWRIFLNCLIDMGSYDQLIAFLNSYQEVYGLHESDRFICLLKFFLRRNMTDISLKLWDDAVPLGILDERAYAHMARTFARLGNFEIAFKFLDDAWLEALRTQSFKITHIFYAAAAQTYIAAHDLHKLEDLFTRLHANKPSLKPLFYERLFRALNHATYGTGSRPAPSDLEEEDDAEDELELSDHNFDSTSDSSHKRKLDKSSQTTQKVKKDAEEYVPKKMSQEDAMKFFKVIESSLNAQPMRPSTALRNEIIAFKLYTLNDIPQMFQVVSSYSTSPDVGTLNLMVDALLNNGRYAVASQLMDAWDGQFGIKPNRSTEYLISRYLLRLISEPTSPKEGDLGRAATAADPLPDIYQLQSPAFDLFEEFAMLKKIHIYSKSLHTFWRFLRDLEMEKATTNKHSSHTLSPGYSRFFSYLESVATKGISSSTSRTLYENIMEDLKQAGQLEAFLRIGQVAKKHLAGNHPQLHKIVALEINTMLPYEGLAELEVRWKEAKRLGVAGYDHVSVPYARFLARTKPAPVRLMKEFLTDLMHGKIALRLRVLDVAVRMMWELNREGWNPLAFFDLIRLRRLAKLPFAPRVASQVAVLLISRARYYLPHKEAQDLEEELKPYILDKTDVATMSPAQYARVMKAKYVSKLDQIIDRAEPLFLASTRPYAAWYESPKELSLPNTQLINPRLFQRERRKFRKQLLSSSSSSDDVL